jgi:putative membrane protein insertion efficiency factor
VSALSRWPRRAGVAAVRLYQGTLAPVLGGQCRFHPSCSEFAVQALERHGLLRGGWLALRRVGRCNPLGGHGFDPVP